ncbi:MAG: Acylphosphatase [Candidatus Magasanikbacteria bacterium GW2011_GWA2_37_8]|uniref:acylphosphatase n=1 Tax=Candidatus Magasanikbacteria bacterium GW2011_GWA2_37_8 TaxID=1619036 RepID=A0A0G0HDE6_9BACT|nr:MAG: Acylphosphatase [Candidatus Magasanikbacteria bacterium GW2011_GWA2_37_8]
MLIRVHIFVSGLVQGVTFRAFAKQQANYLKIKGWVTNLDDGRVEIVLEGEEKLVEILINQLKSGPHFAKIENFSVDYESYSGEFKNFSIKY